MARAELRRLTHRYGGVLAPALEEVDLDVEPGLMLLSGPSGSGKSTLLRVLNGLVPHFHGGRISGSALVCGHNVFRTPTRVLARHVGFVFQDAEAQLVGGSVEREVAFGLENLGVPRPEMQTRVDDALERCGIAALRTRAIATLSGGERQRVAIACSVAMRCDVLALDEPTAQLDAEGASAVVALMADLARSGTAVVVAEHRLERLLDVADRLGLLTAGRLRGPGDVRSLAADLCAPPQVIRLGTAAGWRPLALTVGEVRGRMPGLRTMDLKVADARAAGRHAGEQCWSLDGVAAGPSRRAILEDVILHGAAGEVVVLVGPNGGGKTTLLRVIAGLLPPHRGSVVRRAGRVALLPQDPTAVLHLPTVRAEVALTLRRTGAHDEGEADRILAELGLTDQAMRHPRDLSAGQRQRAALAAMLCGRPSLALLDEPTRGMDETSRAALIGLVRGLADDGAAVVLATHDSDLAAAVADRVVEVRAGCARELESARAALTAPSPYATQIGGLLPGGPVTAEEALLLL